MSNKNNKKNIIKKKGVKSENSAETQENKTPVLLTTDDLAEIGFETITASGKKLLCAEMKEAFALETETGRLEGKAGDVLIIHPDGSFEIQEKDKFLSAVKKDTLLENVEKKVCMSFNKASAEMAAGRTVAREAWSEIGLKLYCNTASGGSDYILYNPKHPKTTFIWNESDTDKKATDWIVVDPVDK